MKKLLTVSELVQTLCVPTSLIYRWHHEGKQIPGRLNFGRRTIRYDADKVNQWLDELADSENNESQA